MARPKKRRGRYNLADADFHKEDFPFYWLARVHGRYSMAMDRLLKKVDMDIPRWRIINILYETEHASISEISEYAVAKLSTVTKIVYRMKDEGLVDTCQSPDDGRVTQVNLTQAGHEMFLEMHEVTQELINDSFKGMTDAQLRKLNQLLSAVFTNLPEH